MKQIELMTLIKIVRVHPLNQCYLCSKKGTLMTQIKLMLTDKNCPCKSALSVFKKRNADEVEFNK